MSEEEKIACIERMKVHLKSIQSLCEEHLTALDSNDRDAINNPNYSIGLEAEYLRKEWQNIFKYY